MTWFGWFASLVSHVLMRSFTAVYGARGKNPNFLSERHPLRAAKREPFFADKMAAESEALRFAQRAQGSVRRSRSATAQRPLRRACCSPRRHSRARQSASESPT